MPTINLHITAPGQRLDSDFLTLDVTLDLTLADLKAYINAETQLDPTKLRIFRDGQALSGDNGTLAQAGIKDGDMLAVVVPQDGTSNPPTAQSRGDGTAQEAETIRQQLLRNRSALSQQPAPVQEAVNSPERFRALYEEVRRRQTESANQDALNEADPFDMDAQRRIEEAIRRQNVQENLEHAYNFSPESFGSVTMLYINVKVNGVPIKAFVDSGAQTTIMSPSCAESCNIMRLIDTNFSGIARGVGTAKILGRVHSADLNIAGNFLPCSFTVMEGKAVDLLLGLDMLKRYQACIDLKRNKLIFQDFDIDFLPESELPKFQEEERAAEETVPGPAGTSIGTETGTVRPAGGSGASQPPTGAQTSSQSASTGGQPSSAPPTSSSDRRAGISQLVSLGFSEQEAAQALDACDGNVDAAAGLLFP